jgi:predicted ATPase
VSAKTNLRRPRKAFIGRGPQLQRIVQLFEAGERFVTLVGPAGIGKTRVALELMASSLDDYGTAWFCDLTEARTVEDICRVVSGAIGARSAETPEEIGVALAAVPELLIVFDNCEQIADHMAATVVAWSELAEGAHVVVTSREPLRLEGEVVLEIGALETDEAIDLFIDRARRVAADWELDAANRPVIAKIVERLDGMPLAIELAAARVGVLSLPDLLERLERRFELLSSSSREVVDRHRTLRAAIDWTWDMLQQWEQAGLAQLSAFRGGFSIHAADTIVRVQHLPDAPDVIGGLSGLRDRSLVWADSAIDADGTSRCGLYLSVRDYAAEKLADLGFEAGTFERHVAYFRNLAEQWAVDPVAEHTLRAVDREQENLLVAFERMADSDPYEFARGLECLLALEHLRAARGPWKQYVERLDRAISAPGFGAMKPGVAARAFQARGRVRGLLGQFEGATQDLGRALELAIAAGDGRVEGTLLMRLGVLASNSGRFDKARDHHERALELFRDIEYRHGEGQAHANLGVLEGQLGELAAARQRFAKAQAIYAEVGDRRLQARTTGNLATLNQDDGNLDEALIYYGQAIDSLDELGNRRDAAVFRGFRGTLRQEQGDLVAARDDYDAAIAELRAVGDRPFEGLFTGHRATVAAAEDDVALASRMLTDADMMLSGTGDTGAGVALGIHRAHIDLAFARRAQVRGDTEGVAARRQSAMERLAEANPPDQIASQRVRVASRILEHVLGVGDADVGADAGDILHIGPEAKWFQVPGSGRVDLFRRHTLRRLLHTLAVRRAEHPGEGFPVDEMFKAGWPKERVASSAAANRVRVAVTTLRRLGLRDTLVTRSDGYLLDPNKPLRFDG